MDRQTETGQNRNIGYENQLPVGTISLRHLGVALCSANMSCVGEGGCTSPVDVHRPEHIPQDFCTCTSTGPPALRIPKAHQGRNNSQSGRCLDFWETQSSSGG